MEQMSRRDFLMVAPGALAMGAALPAGNKTYYPVRLGVDDTRLAGDPPAAQVSQLFAILDDLGLKHIDIHLRPITRFGDQNPVLMAKKIRQIDETLRARGITYTLNVEAPNYSPVAEITPGVNEFDQPGGLHRWDLRMEWLKAILPPEAQAPQAFQGLVYDECGHMQLSNNKFSNPPRNDFDRPYLVDTQGMDLETAYVHLVAECRRILEAHYEGRVRISTEQVWPDLFHIFASAGWTLGSKLLKEHLSSVVLSIALGAGLQYADRTRLWASPDLWRFGECPGHSAEALRSALLMAYWLGMETIYVEGMNRPYTAVRHPDAVTPGKLVYEPEGAPYQVTAYGRVVREFAREYVTAHPRPITWRDYRPRVAIVRLPDGGWGQSPPDPVADEYPSRNRLLGNREMPLDKAASEWLYIWPILTHHTARPGAITIFNVWTYPERLDFFVPIDSVAVFDHTVEGQVLDSVECFVVCGHALSAATFNAIQARVRDGATCIIARRLYKAHASGELPGKWLVFDSSVDPGIASTLQPFLGPPDVARFRFAHHTVEFRKGPKTDQIEVQVRES